MASRAPTPTQPRRDCTCWIAGFVVIAEIHGLAIIVEVDGLPLVGIGAAAVAAKALVATPIIPLRAAQTRLRLNMAHTFLSQQEFSAASNTQDV
jgi:hypothetical protein